MFRTREMEVDGHRWNGARGAWVNADGVMPDGAEIQEALDNKAKDIASNGVITRLSVAEAAFQNMRNSQERHAALRWLDVAFNLDLNNK